jgi:hypothetical protein
MPEGQDRLAERLAELRARGLFVADPVDPIWQPTEQPDVAEYELPTVDQHIAGLRARGLFVADLADPLLQRNTDDLDEDDLDEDDLDEDDLDEDDLDEDDLDEDDLDEDDLDEDYLVELLVEIDEDDEYDEPEALRTPTCQCRGRGWMRRDGHIRICPVCRGRGLEGGVFDLDNDDNDQLFTGESAWDIDELLIAAVRVGASELIIEPGCCPWIRDRQYERQLLTGWGVFDELAQARVLRCLLVEQRQQLYEDRYTSCMWDAAGQDFTLRFTDHDGQVTVQANIR